MAKTQEFDELGRLAGGPQHLQAGRCWKLTDIAYGGVHKWGYSQIIHIYGWIFPNQNHPAIKGYPHGYGNCIGSSDLGRVRRWYRVLSTKHGIQLTMGISSEIIYCRYTIYQKLILWLSDIISEIAIWPYEISYDWCLSELLREPFTGESSSFPYSYELIWPWKMASINVFSDMPNVGKKQHSLDASQNWWTKEHVACVNVGAVALYNKLKKDVDRWLILQEKL